MRLLHNYFRLEWELEMLSMSFYLTEHLPVVGALHRLPVLSVGPLRNAEWY